MRFALVGLFTLILTGSALCQQPTPTAMPPSEKPYEVNVRPLIDLAEMINSEIEQQHLDLTQNFSVTLDGVVRSDGTFDVSRSRFLVRKASGDPQMIAVGKEALQALGSTRVLAFLEGLGIDHVFLVLRQDDAQTRLELTSAARSADDAAKIASGLNAVIHLIEKTAKMSRAQSKLVEGWTSRSDGTTLIIAFALPKPVAQDVIKAALFDAKTYRGSKSSGKLLRK